jgi:hypothetical protein
MRKRADGNIESMENSKRGLKSKWASRQLRAEMIKAIFKSGRVECHVAITSKSTDNVNKKKNPALHNTLAKELLPCAKEGGVRHRRATIVTCKGVISL